MDKTIQKSIAGYLAAHRYMALASVDPDGRPVVHTMGYGSDGDTVYCATNRETRKVHNIKRNSNVALAVSEDYDEWGEIQGVQIQGKATFIHDEDEIKRVIAILAKNFPQFASLGPNPNIIFFKIEPVEGFFIDYKKGFGYRESVTY